jgi:hypothetical protein
MGPIQNFDSLPCGTVPLEGGLRVPYFNGLYACGLRVLVNNSRQYSIHNIVSPRSKWIRQLY